MILWEGIYDCIIDNWHKFLETGEFKWLVKEGKFKENEKFYILVDRIQCQLIDEFGVSVQYELKFYKQKTINKLEIQVLKGHTEHEDKINLLKHELEHLEKKMSKGQDEDLKKYHARQHRMIQTHYPGRDSHKLTIFEFNNDFHDIIKANKDRAQQESSRKDNAMRHKGMVV
jgi:hypothetical protein